jgi:hypothetical protein
MSASTTSIRQHAPSPSHSPADLPAARTSPSAHATHPIHRSLHLPDYTSGMARRAYRRRRGLFNHTHTPSPTLLSTSPTITTSFYLLHPSHALWRLSPSRTLPLSHARARSHLHSFLRTLPFTTLTPFYIPYPSLPSSYHTPRSYATLALTHTSRASSSPLLPTAFTFSTHLTHALTLLVTHTSSSHPPLHCFDSLLRCLLHGCTKGFSDFSSKSPLRLRAMSPPLLLMSVHLTVNDFDYVYITLRIPLTGHKRSREKSRNEVHLHCGLSQRLAYRTFYSMLRNVQFPVDTTIKVTNKLFKNFT